jgi:hypothetical protein
MRALEECADDGESMVEIRFELRIRRGALFIVCQLSSEYIADIYVSRRRIVTQTESHVRIPNRHAPHRK